MTINLTCFQKMSYNEDIARSVGVTTRDLTNSENHGIAVVLGAETVAKLRDSGTVLNLSEARRAALDTIDNGDSVAWWSMKLRYLHLHGQEPRP